METLFHGTNVILIALVNYHKKNEGKRGVLIGRISETCLKIWILQYEMSFDLSLQI
jgi:hypothetical protein